MLSTAQLADQIKGRVIAPDDADYDRARRVFAAAVDRRPAVIVRAADTDDIARVIGMARETGLDLAVRSGGHSNAGHGVCEGGIVLDLGLALSRALGRDDVEPHVQTVRLLGVEELDLGRNVAPLGEAYGGFAASHEDLLAAAAEAGLTGIA